MLYMSDHSIRRGFEAADFLLSAIENLSDVLVPFWSARLLLSSICKIADILHCCRYEPSRLGSYGYEEIFGAKLISNMRFSLTVVAKPETVGRETLCHSNDPASQEY